MTAHTLTLTPTRYSLSFPPKSIKLERDAPIILGRQGKLGAGDPEKEKEKQESPSNGYFTTGVGINSVSRQHATVWMDHKEQVNQS